MHGGKNLIVVKGKSALAVLSEGKSALAVLSLFTHITTITWQHLEGTKSTISTIESGAFYSKHNIQMKDQKPQGATIVEG